MRKLAYAINVVAIIAVACFGWALKGWAQCNGVFPANTWCGNPTGAAKPPGANTFGSTLVGSGVTSMGALRALAPGVFSAVYLQGYFTGGDGGEGVFIWNPSSTATDDAGVTIIPNAGGTGRWIRATYSTEPNVRWWGAACDYTDATGIGTDDTSAFGAAVTWAGTTSGASFMIPRGTACAIKSGVGISSNNIKFYSVGNNLRHSAPTNVAQQATCGAVVVWTGLTGGWLFHWFSAGTYSVNGGGLENLCLDGKLVGSGGVGVMLHSARAMDFRSLYIEGFSGAGIQADVLPNINGGVNLTRDACDTQRNTFEHIYINNLFTTLYGLNLEAYFNPSFGNGGCNASGNQFRDIVIDVGGVSAALIDHSGDHNIFDHISIFRGSSGNAPLLDLTRTANGSLSAGFVAGNETFIKFDPTAAISPSVIATIRGTATFSQATPGIATFISYDAATVSLPTLEPGAKMTMLGDQAFTITSGVSVASLQACNASSQGMQAFVTDQTSPTTYLGTATGGGTLKIGVICNGTSWLQH